MADELAIELKAVKKTYVDFWHRPVTTAVNSLDLEVQQGEVFGLLGPNGSGKSTTIKLILGLLRPTAGMVRVLGEEPDCPKVREQLGYLPELSALHPFLSVRETLAYYGGLCGLPSKVIRQRSDELIEMIGLKQVEKRAVGGFSKGMARRVALATALIGKPKLLVLDEPTSGLDPISTAEVKQLIRELVKAGTTILLSSHHLADAQDICHRVAILDRGSRVALGAVDEIDSSLEEYFLSKVAESSAFKVAAFLT